jgi:hypothetical protein
MGTEAYHLCNSKSYIIFGAIWATGREEKEKEKEKE